ncbi:MAG: LutB/LldF family L-lactate oxidation iron-sulfur protein [Liquorilactobacillus nagelii]|jgi:L-lactate dehydrogenase complex protein LldF|uniref:LutB/LldF family L-lactate oxidation iron-sulfur protein n=1 Tax=Liquorilactobacillus nagelii TaxID=82688 RepID=UPI0024310CE2|nr:LutB/LldF family L-lactate oxidation iron-sulfur protein [Liquorilactobacillus nagelii]MCI1921441.1 LutB/LldF family L-lactate oxidation iron-sulfur protein [Liquorilactobacillus nagelii]MCI1977902.1 LutB/LldF family L-lactate oxidation iron-sulfur protein [Liquorilactobacillus nagelii]
MATLSTSNEPFLTRIKESEDDKFMQKSVAKAQDAQWEKRPASRKELGHWEDWRNLGEQIRQHVIKYLPDYLEEFSDNVEKRGGHVFFAQTDKEAVDYIKKIAQQKKAHKIVKSKSMVTTEINLDKELLKLPDTSVLETDLAEFILEEDNWDEPTHIVFPTLHKNRDQIQKIFQKLGYKGSNEPGEMAKFARHYLRQSFLEADLGITGCNFAIADQGMINLVTNEGNADLTMAIPDTQVVVMGMERIVPSLKEAEVMDNMLSRSAVGQKLTSYCTFAGPQTADESDGPKDFYVVILDNGRSKALGTDFEPALQCIRCGSCLNVCPVYRHIGGHGYGSIYPGPIGAVLSPILCGYEKFKDLPFACSLNAACTDTCPVKIPLHKLLIKHREVMMDKMKLDHSFNNVLLKGAGVATAAPIVFNIALKGAYLGSAPLAKKSQTSVDNFFNFGHIEWAPSLAKGWTDVRSLPRPAKSSENFRSWYKKHQAAKEAQVKEEHNNG